MKKYLLAPLLLIPVGCSLFFGSNISAPEMETFKALFKPLPKMAESSSNPITSEKVTLGRKLYFETQLSKSGELSCNSCHNLKTFGVDNEATSKGHLGQRGGRNSPSVYNAALHVAQFWDGRSESIETQALGPMMNPIEMAIPSEKEVIRRLSSTPEYNQLFASAFPGEKPLTFENIGKAIGAFERTLLTPSRFDRFLEGDVEALNQKEIRGLKKFNEVGCNACHSGVGMGGSMYQKVGLVYPYETSDLGRYDTTKVESDKHVFKVPSLRNIEKTAPYFHDGRVQTLDQAVKLMAHHQLGRILQDSEVGEIIAFLRTLTGTHAEIPINQ